MSAFSTLFLTFLVFLCSSFQIILSDDAKLWAVLVAGSNSYYNYRHQADICHAYQILHSHGIPDEQIIVMMYDDIANSPQNPTPGIIVNQPNGSDVYHDVPKDYVGDNVNSKTFMNVLLGKGEDLVGRGSGKFLKSGPNDHVFINFADHGAPHLLAFPNDELYAKDLIKTLETMYKKKKFGKLVFYVEACESGSMFDALKKNINIFATTAANGDESSYACYYDDERQTYLGDVYSVKWMEDSDSEDIAQETLDKQFSIVKNETTTSHVMEFGDLTIGKMSVSEFQGRKSSFSVTKKTFRKNSEIIDAVPSFEVPLMILRKSLSKAQFENSADKVIEIQKQIFKLESNRKYLLEKVKNVVRLAIPQANKTKMVWSQKLHLSEKNYECYESVARYFSKNCFNLSKNDYALRYMFIFVNMCEIGIKPKAMKKAMDIACTHPPMCGIY